MPSPAALLVESPEGAAQAFRDLGGQIAVVKSQIHAGGRGKGHFKEHPEQGGVVLVKSAEEAAQNASRMLGKTLVTKQTGPAGKTVNVLLVEEGLKIARELYLGVVVDRGAGGPVLIMSSEGGTEIEEVAAHSPEKILREPIDAGYGLFAYQVTKLAYKLGLPAAAIKSAHKFLPQVARFFIDNDCSLTEINPLVITESGDLMALDAKMTFDDNAMFRHKPFDAPARLVGGGRFGNPRRGGRAQLRQAGRQHRLLGQRGRPGDEHDGSHQAAWRRAGELP